MTPRTDDNIETFKKRLALYKDYSKPIIEYYEKKGILKKVDTEDTKTLTDDEIRALIEI